MPGQADLWEPGQRVVLREVWRGRVWAALPATVVEDRPGQSVFFVPAGARTKYAVDGAGRQLRLYTDRWELADHLATRSALSFSWPHRRHAVLGLWEAGWEFAGWYINVETPLRRTELGLDFVDHAIDVLVPPDRSTWTWKDEEELEEAVRRGIWSAEEAAAFRAEAERAARRLLAGEPPFDRDWASWRPDPAWGVPELPPGWDRVEPLG